MKISPQQRATLLAAWDQEFIFGKGRRLGFARRFPFLRGAAAFKVSAVVSAEGQPVSAAVAKPFIYRQGREVVKCAAIGLVWTDAQHRGQGLGSQVMRDLLHQLETTGTDAVFLWTSIAPFYEGVGFKTKDTSVFGVHACGEASVSSRERVKPVRLSPKLIASLEGIRSRWSTSRVVRDAAAWKQLPVPAETMEVFTLPGAYALAGRQGATRYVYELHGAPSRFPALWAGLNHGVDKLCLNDAVGNAAADFYRAQGVALQRQTLTMWQPLTPRGKTLSRGFHIPFFDRI